MPKQMTFASLAHASKKKVTRREKFLAEMDAVVPWGRLLGLTLAAGPNVGASYGYDPLGRRSSKTVSGATTEDKQFLYDGTDVIADLDASGVVTRRFIHGPGVDEPVAMYIGTGDTTRRFYVTDPLGSVIAMTGGSGDLKAQHSYSAYGIPDDADIELGNPYRYTARRWDEETGLSYYRARYYSPALGRFLSPDPIGYEDGLNLYAYVGNDPVNMVDPSGTKLYPGGATSGYSVVNTGYNGSESFDDSGSVQTAGDIGLMLMKRQRPGLQSTVSDFLGGGGRGPSYGSFKNSTSLSSGTVRPYSGSSGGPKQVAQPSVATRTNRQGGKSVEIVYPSGRKVDISASRVKEFQLSTHPKAPPGTFQRLKFDNAIPGSRVRTH